MKVQWQVSRKMEPNVPAAELRIGNQVAYLRKAISQPLFESESVLTLDAFQFASLWLQRNCKKALPYWRQASIYYSAAKSLPPEASPLPAYYCFLNAAKALLLVKGETFSDRHGVAGKFDAAKRTLSNEIVQVHESGILAALSKYLDEPETEKSHTLQQLLANLPFVHRSYCHTFRSQTPLFVPIRNPRYLLHPQLPEVWLSFDISGRFADKKTLNTVPSLFEIDLGLTKDSKYVMRTKTRARYFRRGATKADKDKGYAQLQKLHKKVRVHLSFISAPIDLWYVKRKTGSIPSIQRHNLTICMAAMHRLSELSRYDPSGLLKHLSGPANWLLTEFIQLSPSQFIDELVCEMTGLEVRMPGVRP